MGKFRVEQFAVCIPKQHQPAVAVSEGEIRTEQIAEADKYNYETLNLKERNLDYNGNP